MENVIVETIFVAIESGVFSGSVVVLIELSQPVFILDEKAKFWILQ